MSNVALTCLQVLPEMAFTYVAKNYLFAGCVLCWSNGKRRCQQCTRGIYYAVCVWNWNDKEQPATGTKAKIHHYKVFQGLTV